MQDLQRIQLDETRRAEKLAGAQNPLETVYYGHTGRMVQKWHHYLALYHRHLARFRGTPVRLLELGINYGGSLQVWKEYFGAEAEIHGIDINPDCAHIAEDRIVPHIGDQADARLLREVVDRMGGVDIVIDDGSHIGADQIASFEALYPCLSETGVYICEDTRAAYWARYEGGTRRPGTFVEYAKDLVDRLHATYREDKGAEADRAFAAMTRGVLIYDSMIVIEKRPPEHPVQYIVGTRDRGAPA